MYKHRHLSSLFQSVRPIIFRNVYLRAMYLYNVTIIVENDIRDAVKRMLRAQVAGKQTPDGSLALLELLDSPHEGVTYCLQLRCSDQAAIAAFQAQGLTALQGELNEQYPGQVVFFDSMMKYLND